MMTSHLILPYNWVECADPETCEEYVHLQDSADDLNSYPKEWVEELLPAECVDERRAITLYNSEKEVHASTGAAKEHKSGSLEWWDRGLVHRVDGPAVIWEDGTEEWKFNGNFHRENGPAITRADGTKEWWWHGNPHREDGPAIIGGDGTQTWFLNGFLHRTDGPAIIWPHEEDQWWVNGQQMKQSEHEELIRAHTKHNQADKISLMKKLRTFLRKLARIRNT